MPFLSFVARASRPLSRGHPARACPIADVASGIVSVRGLAPSCQRERDAPAAAGETPALQTTRHPIPQA